MDVSLWSPGPQWPAQDLRGQAAGLWHPCGGGGLQAPGKQCGRPLPGPGACRPRLCSHMRGTQPGLRDTDTPSLTPDSESLQSITALNDSSLYLFILYRYRRFIVEPDVSCCFLQYSEHFQIKSISNTDAGRKKSSVKAKSVSLGQWHSCNLGRHHHLAQFNDYQSWLSVYSLSLPLNKQYSSVH